MEKLDDIKAIAFDADDTLWALQNHFEDVEDEYCDLLADYGSKEEISAALFETESGNMADLGYGVKAFIISLVENAIKVSEGKASARLIGRIVEVGKSLLHVDAKPLEGVEKTLAKLRERKASNGSETSLGSLHEGRADGPGKQVVAFGLATIFRCGEHRKQQDA